MLEQQRVSVVDAGPLLIQHLASVVFYARKMSGLFSESGTGSCEWVVYFDQTFICTQNSPYPAQRACVLTLNSSQVNHRYIKSVCKILPDILLNCHGIVS